MCAMQNGNMRMSTSSLDDVSGNFCSQSAEDKTTESQSLDEQEILVDKYCNPKNPQRISFHDVTSAAFLIKDDIEKTPCPVGNFNHLINYSNLQQ